jgi:hypothetical protein
MNQRFLDARLWARIFWVLSITSIVIWALIPSYRIGWDVDVYHQAIDSLRAGHNPYADAIAVEQAYQLNPLAYIGAPIPYCYVYSPITLPLLRLLARFPLTAVGATYWTIYAIFAALLVWAPMRLVQTKEKSVFSLLATLAIFFPGLIENDTLFCGNVAIILYGLAWCMAVVGWKKHRWAPFYAAVLVAGCFKAPMLSLLAIPVLSARRQWLPALATGIAGMALFLMQPRIWPDLFRTYLEAVDLQFRFNRDFSSSPAGLIANALFHQAPYRTTSVVAYLCYAVIVAAVLFYFSRRFLAGLITLEQFGPLLLVGTILLNPRIMEYDLLPITLPMALLLWRAIARGRTLIPTIVIFSLVFSVIQVLAVRDHIGLENPPWKLTAGCTLVAVFLAGAWNLWLETRDAQAHPSRELQPHPI